MTSRIIAGGVSGTVALLAPDAAGTSVLTLPVATDTLVGKNTTDVLTNKTLTAPTINGTVGGSPVFGTIYATTLYAEVVGNSADLSWNSTTDSYTRSVGAATDQKITNIHTKMRRCLVLDNGTVNYYLNATDSTLILAGGASDLSGAAGMVMVEIPKFYVKYSYVGTLHTWSIAEVPMPGYTLHPAFILDGLEVNNRYIGAYDACVWTTGTTYQSGLNWDDNVGAGQNWTVASAKLASVSGIYPAIGINRAEARTMAANIGTGWRQQDFFLTSAIQLLYLIEYGNFNSQTKIGAGNTAVTNAYTPASSATQTDSPHSVAGKSNSIGNATGAVASTSRDTAWMSYRGIENFYGNCCKWLDGINVNNLQSYVVNQGQRSYLADDTATNYTAIGGLLPSSDNYQTNVYPLNNAFLPSSVGGSSSTFLCDYYYHNGSGWMAPVLGGAANATTGAGAFYLNASIGFSVVGRFIGARCAR